MHHPVNPVSWKDIAASYDPRGLPFLRYYREAGMRADGGAEPSQVLVQSEFRGRS